MNELAYQNAFLIQKVTGPNCSLIGSLNSNNKDVHPKHTSQNNQVFYRFYSFSHALILFYYFRHLKTTILVQF